MVFRSNPQLGPQLDDVFTGAPYWDQGLGIGTPANGQGPSPQLGTRETGSDAHDYVWVKASADIAAATQVTIDEPAFTAAAGSGGWYTVGAITSGQFFWARKGALDAP